MIRRRSMLASRPLAQRPAFRFRNAVSSSPPPIETAAPRPDSLFGTRRVILLDDCYLSRALDLLSKVLDLFIDRAEMTPALYQGQLHPHSSNSPHILLRCTRMPGLALIFANT
ncbi:hypothetical protein BJX65DRAFT_265180 [Aspergillus insuetus]